jgi:hypothetical protein
MASQFKQLLSSLGTSTRVRRVSASESESCWGSASTLRIAVRIAKRRYTRLANAFSKKIENYAEAVALGYFAYDFIKIHRTLRTTPAMAAGVTDRLWEVSDFVALIEAEERRSERAA